jgi:hypothetical protein
MQVYELETKNGRIFRVAITDSKSQENRLIKVIAENKKKNYETFIRVDCIKSGIHNIKDFELLANSLT